MFNYWYFSPMFLFQLHIFFHPNYCTQTNIKMKTPFKKDHKEMTSKEYPTNQRSGFQR